MKRLKKILCLILIMGIALSLHNTRSVAAEVQYTENVIPAMTSDTSQSGTAKASSVFTSNGSFPAYLAFDHISSNRTSAWATPLHTTTGWIEYDFSTEKCITKYTIAPRNWAEYTSELPTDWTFEAWDENTGEWVVLDTQTNVTGWVVNSKKEFTFTNTTYYNNYRINISKIGNSELLIAIGEIEMMETVPQGSNATIYITMVTGEIKEYHVDSSIEQDYLTWYDDRSQGNGKAYYTFTKDTTGGFLSRKEYLAFDKISSFEIMEYDD